MMEVLAAFFTGVPVILGAALGARAGGRRVLGAGASLVLAWLAGLAAALGAFHAAWFQPLGLATPVLLGAAVLFLARALIRGAASRPARSRPLSLTGRGAGALLGAASGLAAAASAWLLLFILCAVAAAPAEAPPPAGGARAGNVFQALVRTANRGFVRHLPVIGTLEEEVEALAVILRASTGARAELARRAGWDGLLALPTLQAIIDDRATLEDIDKVGRPDIAALYRLQKNPLILAFCAEEEVRKLMRETRPTLLARELEAIEAGSVRSCTGE